MILSQRPSFIYGLILLFAGVLGVFSILGCWYLDRIELREKEQKQIGIDRQVAWENYYALNLKVPLNQIKQLPVDSHVVVAGVDLTLHNAVQGIQNSTFDTLLIDEVGSVAFM